MKTFGQKQKKISRSFSLDSNPSLLKQDSARPLQSHQEKLKHHIDSAPVCVQCLLTVDKVLCYHSYFHRASLEVRDVEVFFVIVKK